MTQEFELSTPADDSDLTSRARIRNAGLYRFATSGFSATPMRTIAADAGVAIGLISHYFGSKEGLREAVESWIVDQVRSAFEQADELSDGPVADAAARDAAVAEMLAENPLMVAYLRRAILDKSDSYVPLVNRLAVLTMQSVDSMRETGQASKDKNRVSQVVAVMVRQLGKLFLQPFIDQIVHAFPEEERPDARPELSVALVPEE